MLFRSRCYNTAQHNTTQHITAAKDLQLRAELGFSWLLTAGVEKL
jgi:hypothetical protein